MLKMKFNILAATVAAFVVSAGAAQNDGLVFDLDLSAGDVNGNGRAEANEVRDRMSVSAAVPVTAAEVRCMETGGEVHTVAMPTLDVYDPWFGLSSATNGIPCLYFPQTVTTIDGAVKCSAEYVKFAKPPVTSSCTVHLRFRWDGNTIAASHNCFIAMNGYYWGGDRGWGVGLYEYANNANEADMLVMIGTSSANTKDKNTSIKVHSGRWYDAVYVLDKVGDTGCRVTMYLCEESGYRSTVKTYSQTFDKGINLTPVDSYGFWIGGENRTHYDDWPSTTANAVANVFRGAIADVRVWNRALDADEVNAVFSGSSGERWNIGAANGSCDEFGAESVPDVFNVDAHSWAEFPRSLTASRAELAVSAPLKEGEERMPQVLTFVPVLSDKTKDSCPVEISVNGRVAGTLDLAAKTQFLIKRRFVRRDASGRLNVKIRRLTTEGTLGIDALSMSGSFLIGVKNDKNSEFTSTRYTGQLFVVGDGTDKHFVDALWHNAAAGDGHNTSSYSNVCIQAYLPVEAVRAPVTFHVRMNCRGKPDSNGDQPVRTVALYVNGARKTSWTGDGSGTMQDFSFDFASGEIPSGFVQFMLSDETFMPGMSSANRWAYIDYVQLEAVGFPDGTVFILR